MKRPIEKYGWKYYGANNKLETEVFKRDVYTMNIYIYIKMVAYISATVT